MPTSPTCQRWLPRYSLQTLFVVMTLFAVWLGWELSFIRERRRMLSTIREHRGRVVSPEHWQLISWQTQGPISLDRAPHKLAQITTVRRWLGDEAVGAIELPYNYNDRDLARFQHLFPEATVRHFQAAAH